MPQVISSSKLRSEIKQVLNEVGYGQRQYIIERFGEPTAAVISMEDLRLLQAIKKQQSKISLGETIANLRSRQDEIEPDALTDLIEEARADFYAKTNQDTNA